MLIIDKSISAITVHIKQNNKIILNYKVNLSTSVISIKLIYVHVYNNNKL